jgi:hypothetical protein
MEIAPSINFDFGETPRSEHIRTKRQQHGHRKKAAEVAGEPRQLGAISGMMFRMASSIVQRFREWLAGHLNRENAAA